MTRPMGLLVPLIGDNDATMRTELVPSQEWLARITEYMSWLGASGQPATTQKLRSYHLRRFATTTGLRPFQVTLDDLVDWIDDDAWERSTRRSYRTTFRSFYKWAKTKGHMKHNPAKALPKIHVTPGVPRPAPEDALSIGLATTDTRTRLMVQLAATCGLRCREIALVQTRDVKHDIDGFSLQVHGKGDKERIVPIPTELAHRILDSPEGHVFPGLIDGHLSPAYVSKLVSRVLPDGITAHMLRHRFASVAYLGTGGDIRAVQELLGHASVATTQIYTKVPDGAKRRGVLAAA